MTNSEETLKACPNPWCKDTAVQCLEHLEGGFYRIGCTCGVATHAYRSEAEAITAWDTRPSTEQAEVVEARVSVQFAVAYVEGYLEGEPEELQRNWRKVKSAALSQPTEQASRDLLEKAWLFVGHATTRGTIINGTDAKDLQREIEKALGWCAWCGSDKIRDNLDGENLCQSCCDKWARGEGIDQHLGENHDPR